MKLLDGVDPSQLFGLPAPDIATLDDGLQVPFVQTGHEHHEVMLFVHGSLCDFRYWKPQLGPLAKQYRCVAPSLSHYWPSGVLGFGAMAGGSRQVACSGRPLAKIIVTTRR